MPELSRFFGIIIRMYFDDHDPPHFHAVYGDSEAMIAIDPVELIRGNLPPRAVSLVIEWTVIHQQELQENWNRLRTSQSVLRIEPLR